MMITIGDVHGDFVKLYEIIRSVNERGVIFVQVGDFGIGFGSQSRYCEIMDDLNLNRINDHLQDKDSVMYVLRGNHDNPSFWTPNDRMGLSNIKLIQDNTVMELEGKRCLFAGGAPSIDRKRRVIGVSFWENELYRYSPFDGPLDLVFTHDVYHGVSNFSLHNVTVNHFCRTDETLRDYLVKSQSEMKKLYNRLVEVNDGHSVKWYHGHYHQSDYTNNGWLEITCLSILETKELR